MQSAPHLSDILAIRVVGENIFVGRFEWLLLTLHAALGQNVALDTTFPLVFRAAEVATFIVDGDFTWR